MKLQLQDIPETLPSTVQELLPLLDRMVASAVLRPGDDISFVLYQTGARDLVEYLIRLFEEGRQPEEPKSDTWYSGDPELTNYVEGNW